MGRIIELQNVKNPNEYEELVKLFLRPEEYEIRVAGEFDGNEDKNAIKRGLYDELSRESGIRPPWGILTGVRPVKLAGELARRLGSPEAALGALINEYYLGGEKAELAVNTYLYQRETLDAAPEKSLGMYVGIPFCPTRCLYCSFASNKADGGEIERYMKALYSEIDFVSLKMKELGLYPESLYIGGGTPTTLDFRRLDALLLKLENSFDMASCREFSVEAGRPDTIDADKLRVMAEHGVRRISINPQSMNERTLELIGRRHGASEVIRAFGEARKAGFELINADLIAGLPEEGPEDFSRSLEKMIELGAENITVHTLAVKRASRLIEQDSEYHYRQGETVGKMLGIASEKLYAAGYRPYYLYRQKHMAGALENTGWCRDDKIGVYNIRIMEEEQSIAALGAGGISKRYYPDENRLERVPNVTNYEIYIERIDEMKERKNKNFF